MATIDRIMQMQQQGMSDSDIINSLKSEGVSPKEISDSLAQAKIKTAVNQPAQEDSSQGYQESYQPNQQQYSQQPAVQQNVPQEQQYAPYAETPQAYPEQAYYQDQSSMSIDTISEIVDRLLSEKLKDTNQKIKAISDFRSKAETDIQDIKERLKKIESSIDNLQKSVINKVGEFGQSTNLIHRDLENLHGTVSKLMNPLIDNYNELKRVNRK